MEAEEVARLAKVVRQNIRLLSRVQILRGESADPRAGSILRILEKLHSTLEEWDVALLIDRPQRGREIYRIDGDGLNIQRRVRDFEALESEARTVFREGSGPGLTISFESTRGDTGILIGRRVKRGRSSRAEKLMQQTATEISRVLSADSIFEYAVATDVPGIFTRELGEDRLRYEFAKSERSLDPVALCTVRLEALDAQARENMEISIQDAGRLLLEVCRKGDTIFRGQRDSLWVLLPGCGAAEHRLACLRFLQALSTMTDYKVHCGGFVMDDWSLVTGKKHRRVP